MPARRSFRSAYRRDAIGHPLDAFGFVVPAVEGRRILAGSFSSVKFAGRAPEGSVLVRVFIGGACQGELAELPDERVARHRRGRARRAAGHQRRTAVCRRRRWPHSMPQYHVGHADRVAAIERRADRYAGLALAGNAYHGVGIPNCIHSGETAAERVAGALPIQRGRPVRPLSRRHDR